MQKFIRMQPRWCCIGPKLQTHKLPAVCWLFAGCAAILVVLATAALAEDFNQAASTKPADAKSAVGDLAGATTSIVAKVKGEPVFRSDIDKAVASMARNAKIDPKSLPTIQASVLERMINLILLRDFMTSKQLGTTKTEVDAALDRLRTVLKQQHSTFEDFLQETHQTEASFRNSVVQQLAWGKYVSAAAGDGNLEKYFDEVHEQYDGTQRRASHILLRPEGIADAAKMQALKDEASKLREQIVSGSIKFEDAAEKYSAG
ncbi:MAG TPA: SurA N-terminal domain-containing protein, partial [Pirellulales bacterium]